MTTQHPAAPETETDASGKVPAEVIDRLRLLDANRTPGDWKLWGMTVMASQDGTSNVDTAVDVAHTFHRDENGKPRTWDADFIATSARYMSALLADLDAARERVRVVEGERDAAREQGTRLADGLYRWRDDAERYLARAESAEAAHEAEKAAHERLRAGVEALADTWERDNEDHLNRFGQHLMGGAVLSCAEHLRELLGNEEDGR